MYIDVKSDRMRGVEVKRYQLDWRNWASAD